MKKFFTIVFSRVVLIALLLVFQAASLILMLLFFSDMFAQFYAVCVLLTSVVILYIINSKSNPAYKIAWLIPIVLLPIFGGLMYICFGNNHMPLRKRKSMSMIRSRFDSVINYFPSVANELKEASADAYLQSRYLENCARAPIYNRTATTFLPLGEVKFECMLAELEKAERFIFLEYFIIGTGKMWSAVLEILERKAAAGVEVRVMYDDFGCLFTIPGNFRRQLESKGIKCCVFNKFIPVLSARFNYRDHRKICVIDGCVGFTGGINIADEYINAYEKHGHWKDCSVMLRGDAVWSLTVMFLSVWDFVRNVDEDFTLFAPLPAQVDTFVSDGYVQPYTDTPLDDEPVGENAYMNMISRAKKYVYISTPYLIIDNEMITALTTAAKCGIDVRIVTPHIPDKKFVFAMTRSYYNVLVESGVKIYEYTPGFIHAKTFVCDDDFAVVGTINLDFRSLYLHYECAAWMYKSSAVLALRDDYVKMLEVCEPFTLEQCKNQSFLTKLWHALLRVFAPLA